MENEYPPVPLHDVVLVVTHLQNEFWHPEGRLRITDTPLAFPDTKERIFRVVEACRELDIPIIYHNETFRPGHPELKVKRNGYVGGSARLLDFEGDNLAVRGDWGAQVLDEIKPRPGYPEYELDNSKVDPFTCSEFEVLLRNLERNILIVVGNSVNFGVEMTVRSANERDYGAVVLSDCTDRMFGDYSEMTMQLILPKYGRVMTSSELISELRAQADTKLRAPELGELTI